MGSRPSRTGLRAPFALTTLLSFPALTSVISTTTCHFERAHRAEKSKAYRPTSRPNCPRKLPPSVTSPSHCRFKHSPLVISTTTCHFERSREIQGLPQAKPYRQPNQLPLPSPYTCAILNTCELRDATATLMGPNRAPSATRPWPLLASHRDCEHQRQLRNDRLRSHAAAADLRFRVASNSTESVSLRYHKHSQTASQIPTLSYWMRHHETRARKNRQAPLIHPCESPPAMLRLYNRRVPTHPTGGPVPCSH